MPFADVAHLAPPVHAMVAPQGATTWRSITVRPGDTIWDLAVRYRTTPQAITAKNHLTAGGSIIHPGQRLLVPGPAAPVKKAPAGAKSGTVKPRQPMSVHVVKAGETLWDIAIARRVTLTKLLAANRLRNPGMIYVGQRLNVPVAPKPKPKPTVAAKPTPTSKNTFAGWTYSDATVAAAKANRDTLAKRSVPSRTETAAMIKRTATKHGVDPKLALAIAWQESGWNQRQVSVANAIGAMQVIPSSGVWASSLAGRRLDLLNTQDNITAGVLILRALRASADSPEQAIAGYYQGLRSVRERGMYPDTKLYVKSVLAIQARM